MGEGRSERGGMTHAMVDGLLALQRAMWKDGVRAIPPIVISIGDVPVLPLKLLRNGRSVDSQVVFDPKADRYDIWSRSGSGLKEGDLRMDQVMERIK
jgi:hypothetical protein